LNMFLLVLGEVVFTPIYTFNPIQLVGSNNIYVSHRDKPAGTFQKEKHTNLEYDKLTSSLQRNFCLVMIVRNHCGDRRKGG
jgi:hypothetical protein